ncbi:MAG: nucleotide-binding protein, partial [Deltaproteobacteria bacterium]|nr:nucleotide-binding protein [Deltaproteobacteria bacterium]
GWGVATDGSGNVTLTGRFSDTIDLGGGDVVSKGITDVFITSFTSEGVHRWQRGLGGANYDVGEGVAIDGGGNVTVAGRFVGTANFGGGDVTSRGVNDIFVTSFTSEGVHRWQRALGGASTDIAHGVAADNRGNVTVTGSFSGTVDLGGGDITASGGNDIFLTNFSATGVHRWQRTLGGSGSDTVYCVVADHNDMIFTGLFSDTVDLGDGDVTSKGITDVFVVKLGP